MAAPADQVLAEVGSFTAGMLAVLDHTVFALAGAFERAYEKAPGLRGLREFSLIATSIIEQGRAHADDALGIALGALSASLASYPEHGYVDAAQETLDAQGLKGEALDAIDAVMSRIAASHLRQFRHLLLARSPARVISEQDLRVMFRNGAESRIPNALFLVVRQALLDYFNQARIVDLRNAGHSTAQLIHVDPAHESHGLVFALVAGLDFPNYADLFAQGHLHPRANAIVGAR